MKKFLKFNLFLLISICLLASCKKDSDVPKSPVDPAKSGYMPSEENLKLTYTVMDGDEAGTTSVTTVKDVHDSSGYTVAEMVSDVAGYDFLDEHKFNSKKTIIVSNLTMQFNQVMEMMKSQFNVSFTHIERPLVMTIPHQDQKDALIFPTIVTAEFHGLNQEDDVTTKGDYTVTQYAGKIDTLEKVNLPIGEYDCIKIHWKETAHLHEVITDKDGTSNFDNKTEFDETSWLTKGLGVIRTVEVDLKTGEKTTTDLTKIEKR